MTSWLWRRKQTSPASRIRCPCRPAAPAQNLRTHFAVKGHADRLHHHGRAQADGRQSAGFDPFRRQQGPERREDVTYSGTIAAAMEGTLLAFPLSRCRNAIPPRASSGIARDPWRPASSRKSSPRVFRPKVLININFPACPAEEAQGVALSRQGRRDAELMKIEPRFDGRGNPYYWIASSVRFYRWRGHGS